MTTPDRAPAASPYVTGAVLDRLVGLLLVTEGERSNAMTVSFFGEVSHHPTTLWVSVALASYTLEMLERTDRFTLAVLTRDQRAVAEACAAASGRERDKCAGLPLRTTPAGHLYLDGAHTNLACRVRRRIPVGDHVLCVADILEGEAETRVAHRPMLYVSDFAPLTGRTR